MMRVFKISKTYMVAAASKAAAETMVQASAAAELYLVQLTVRELPELASPLRPAQLWLEDLKRQILG